MIAATISRPRGPAGTSTVGATRMLSAARYSVYVWIRWAAGDISPTT